VWNLESQKEIGNVKYGRISHFIEVIHSSFYNMAKVLADPATACAIMCRMYYSIATFESRWKYVCLPAVLLSCGGLFIELQRTCKQAYHIMKNLKGLCDIEEAEIRIGF
jgi:hypothetical protein